MGAYVTSTVLRHHSNSYTSTPWGRAQQIHGSEARPQPPPCAAALTSSRNGMNKADACLVLT
eukprot:scaffold2503_cov301-Prasinococcus_capsulatus_cf.AAC.8